MDRQVIPLGSKWAGSKGVGAGDQEYSPDKVYAAASNKNDHDVVRSVRFPKDVWFWLDSIVHDKEASLWASDVEFVRDAVVHRLHYAATALNNDEAQALKKVLMGRWGIKRRQAEAEERKKATQEITQGMLDCLEWGPEGRAETLRAADDFIAMLDQFGYPSITDDTFHMRLNHLRALVEAEAEDATILYLTEEEG